MAYKSTWWYPNYIEYGNGVKDEKTWLQVQDQYRRPNAIYDFRHYDVPTEECEAMLYHRLPRLGKPVYRATFRDHPHTVPRHYPGPDPREKATGFHGRVYKEYGPTQFKYDGPYKDDLYWLERGAYLPRFPKQGSGVAMQAGSSMNTWGKDGLMEEKPAGRPSSPQPTEGGSVKRGLISI